MKLEVSQLINQKTWQRVERSCIPLGKKVLKGTWALKLKRLSDGTPSKYKAKVCVRGDLQTKGVNYFETYAPVFQWSTVRLVLTMILSHGWHTKQVDYTNAFCKVEIKKKYI